MSPDEIMYLYMLGVTRDSTRVVWSWKVMLQKTVRVWRNNVPYR